MKEFKDYATMLEEKKIKAKKKRENAKRLRDEASYEERLLSYARRDENEDIIANVRAHYTAEQIANKEYLQTTTQYRLRDITKDIEQEYEIEYELTLMKNLLEGFGNRLDMLEGKPPYPYSKVLKYYKD